MYKNTELKCYQQTTLLLIFNAWTATTYFNTLPSRKKAHKSKY